MFGRISALLHQAAEFSSQILITDTTCQNEFKEHWNGITDAITENGSIIIIKDRLDAMLKLLCSEEINSDDPGTVGPCLEFVLRHKILEILFTAAKNNYPAGMDHLILNFLTILLRQFQKPLLHHVSIHQPVLLQVSCCGDDPSSQVCGHQVTFLQALCLRLSKDPRLVDFFLKEENGKKEFVLLKALLRLTNCSDKSVAVQSYQCLLTCASLQHSSVTKALTTGYLPVILASKLQYHFQLIPPTVKYTMILSCQKDWGTGPLFCSDEGALPHVEAFFSWLDYCEKVINVSQKSLGKAVCENISEVFLSASLLPKLVQANEEEILLSSSILARSIQVLSCEMLLEAFVLFTLKDSCALVPGEASNITIKEPLLNKLICRIDHINDDVCHVTLQLFDILLCTPLHVVIECLTSRVISRCILQAEEMRSVRLQLEEDTISYLSLIPDCISSCKIVNGDYFNVYLREAHDTVSRNNDWCRNCSIYSMSKNTSKIEGSLFLNVLLNKLEALLDQPYETNLLVASLFSRLAAIPYPTLWWLFQTGTTERNVYTILKKVAETFQNFVERTPGLVVHVVEARRRLEGQPTSDLLSMPHNNLMEGAIVLEEFIKELCSIIYANTSWSILSLHQKIND